MAVALSPSIGTSVTTEASASRLTSLSALIAVVSTVPLVLMLLGPVSSMMFVRGSAHDGDWLRAVTVILIPLAPATYMLFFACAADMLKKRVPQQVRKETLRVAAYGALPYLAIAGTGFATGNMTLKIMGMLTVPVAIVATIKTSSDK